MITACILTKNSERSLCATLSSLSRLDEIIILDTGSTDQTRSIAQTFPNVSLHETPFTRFGVLRNQAAQLAKNDWILVVDSDEVLSRALEDEILALSLDPKSVYEINFCNYLNGKRIRGCGWHPERHIRLYNRKFTNCCESSVHEGIRTKNLTVVRLKNPIHHTPYRSISDFLTKMQLYSDLFAEEYQGKRSSSVAKAWGHALFAFFKSYVWKRGLFMGKEGAIISLYNAHVAFYKYLKLEEANQKC